jgi:hypothetical protein
MNRWTALVVEVIMFLVISIVGFGLGVFHLWNWLMPELFGLPVITFSQGVGLIGLSWILFHAGFLGRYAVSCRERPGRHGALTADDRARVRQALAK